MASKALADPTIDLQLIGHQVRIFADPALNHRSKAEEFFTFNRHGSNRTVTLNSYQYSLFRGTSAAFVFDTFLIAGLSANEFFVYLYDAR